MGSIENTPAYGRRLVPATIDDFAAEQPDKIFAYLPKSSNVKDGFINVTYSALARAVHRTAWWLEERLGGRSTTFETLAYIGPSDLRYTILMVAAVKTGYKLLLPSPRNSLDGQLSLFSKTECQTIITTTNSRFPIDTYLKHRSMRSLQISDLKELLATSEAPPYKFNKSFEEAKDEPFVVLHTSGSTGLPKPIVLHHSWFASLDAQQNLKPFNGYEIQWKAFSGKTVFGLLPPFHAAGLSIGLTLALFYNTMTVWAPGGRPISASLVDEYLDSVKLDILYAAPSVLEELAQSPESMKSLVKLDAVGFGGGPLSQECGNFMVKSGLRVMNSIGTTEICTFPNFQAEPEDWEYFHVNASLRGIQFQPRDEDLYELVLVRDPSTDGYHEAFHTFPELKEYPMKDLFAQHPSKPNLWIYQGRADDVIVLNNGEKVKPIAMEASLRDHPNVKGALVVGQGRFATGAIIELQDEFGQSVKTAENRARFLESLMPNVEAANAKAPSHAYLERDRIILATNEKPFLRAAKGTINRQVTVKLYKEEIEEMYSRNDQEQTDVQRIDLGQDLKTLEADIRRLVGDVTRIPDVGQEQDLFGAGMDSLHVMTLTKQLKAALAAYPQVQKGITGRLIYGNPNIASLARTLKAISKDSNGTTNGTHTNLARERDTLETLDRYIKLLPQATLGKRKPPQDRLTVILTGSTGSLGSYLLDALIDLTSVKKIYCLNRRASTGAEQAKTNASRGLAACWGDKVSFLKTDLSKSDLGLSKENYERLREEASVIIHNQWQVDFNLSLSSFTPHISGTLNLITLSATSPNAPPIFFTSSIGTLGNWNEKHAGEKVPETELDDPSIPIPQGYSESKWIAERLLDKAREKSGVSSAVCRVGQIAGPVEKRKGGAWNKQEWLPSIIASSVYLNVIPRSLVGQDEITWVPVDTLSKILVELILSTTSSSEAFTEYFHLTNPNPNSWEDLVPVIQSYYGGKLKAVDFREWVDKLEDSAKGDVDVERNPGVKLLEFFQGMTGEGAAVRLETKVTQGGSKTMRELKAVDREWMRVWLEQWGF